MTQEVLQLALEALMRSRKAVSGNLDLAGCAYGKNDLDGHQYSDAKKALVTLDKAITAIKEALAQRKPPTVDVRILQAVSDEYNAWIRAHASGMGYDDFLIQRLAAHGIKENT